jgi:hypothetical protein
MKVILLGTGGPKPDPNRQDPSLAVSCLPQPTWVVVVLLAYTIKL